MRICVQWKETPFACTFETVHKFSLSSFSVLRGRAPMTGRQHPKQIILQRFVRWSYMSRMCFCSLTPLTDSCQVVGFCFFESVSEHNEDEQHVLWGTDSKGNWHSPCSTSTFLSVINVVVTVAYQKNTRWSTLIGTTFYRRRIHGESYSQQGHHSEKATLLQSFLTKKVIWNFMNTSTIRLPSNELVRCQILYIRDQNCIYFFSFYLGESSFRNQTFSHN